MHKPSFQYIVVEIYIFVKPIFFFTELAHFFLGQNTVKKAHKFDSYMGIVYSSIQNHMDASSKL